MWRWTNRSGGTEPEAGGEVLLDEDRGAASALARCALEADARLCCADEAGILFGSGAV